MGLLNLFGDDDDSIASIHERDEEILEEIIDLVSELKELVLRLENSLKADKLEDKEPLLANIENKLLLVISKVDALDDDISLIVQKEMNYKDYITLHDDAYLEDKSERLNALSSKLKEFRELVMARPAFSELKQDLLDRIFELMNEIIEEINVLSEDDEQLEAIYENFPRF